MRQCESRASSGWNGPQSIAWGQQALLHLRQLVGHVTHKAVKLYEMEKNRFGGTWFAPS